MRPRLSPWLWLAFSALPHAAPSAGPVAAPAGAMTTAIAAGERRSGYTQIGPATRAMQDDDAANPGLLWVQEGQGLWQRPAGRTGRACADCHGGAPDSMRGVAARHPAIDPESARPINLEQRINRCRSRHQGAPALPYESRELLALTAFVAHQSRGEPIAIAENATSRPYLAAGRALFERRMGLLNLACTQCHDQHWVQSLGGNPITQAQPTGYPLYRLEWQSLGSLQRRLRGCMASLRAEPYPYGAPELVELELFLMWRAQGLRLETPAVRP